MAEPTLLQCTAETVGNTEEVKDVEQVEALRLEELVIDVRKSVHITAEACSSSQVGANLVLHAGSGTDPEEVIGQLVEAIERFGIRVARYRIVREDLPRQIPVEFRTRVKDA